MALSEEKKAEMRRVIEASRNRKMNVSPEKLEELKQYRDFQPTAEMTPGQQFAGGFQKDRYRNIEKEPTFLTKFARSASKVAPIIGSTLGGTVGRFLGRKAGAIGAGAGQGAGLALGESIENIAGIQDETPSELAREAVVEPVVTGATDYAFDWGLEKAGKAIKPVKDKVAGWGKGLMGEFAPQSKNIFKSIFTVPRKIASRMDLDGMSQKMVDYGINGSLDDFTKVSGEVTGNNGSITKAVRESLANIETPINTSTALDVAQSTADNALNLDDKVVEKTLRKVTNMVSQVQGPEVGKDSAISVWDTVQALEKEGYNLMGKSTDLTPRIDMEQQGEIFLSTADALKDQIDDAIVKSGAIEEIKKKYVPNLLKISPKLAEDFMSATNIREMRRVAKPFVDLSNATRLTQDATSSIFDKVLTGQQGGYRGVELTKPGTWVAPILERPGVKSKIASGTQSAQNITSKAGGAIPLIQKGLVNTFNTGRRAVTSALSDEIVN